MKKLLFITLICIFTVGLFAGTPRTYQQRLFYQATSGGPLLELPGVTNTSTTTNADYLVSAYVTTRPGEVLTTGVNPATTIRVNQTGPVGAKFSVFVLQLGSFPSQWVEGNIVHIDITHLPTGHTGSWEMTIPSGTTGITYTNDAAVIPYVLSPPWPPAPPQNPLPAINPVPPNGAQVQAPVESFFDVFLNWDWDPAGLEPDGYKLYLNGAIEPIIIMGSVNSQYLWVGFSNQVGAVYSWQVVPFIEDAKGKTRDLTPMTKGDAAGCPVWTFEVLPYEEPPMFYIVIVSSSPIGAEIFVDGISSGLYTVEGGTPVELLLPGPHIITLGPVGIYTFPDEIPAAEGSPPLFFEGFVPVELSSFTAVFAAGFYVELAWVVQSETNHLGYNVLRGDSNVLADAATLNVTPISSGSVTGTQISYNFRDEQIESNHTYYYWLESVDLNGMTYFFGPISVIVTSDVPEDPTPVIPTVTALLDAYPNPFNASNATTIRYNLKNSGSVKIEITNLKGQTIWSTVRSYDKAGAYQVSWNGKDMNGKSVATGIYYYRMTSGKYTAGKKIVLVK